MLDHTKCSSGKVVATMGVENGKAPPKKPQIGLFRLLVVNFFLLWKNPLSRKLLMVSIDNPPTKQSWDWIIAEDELLR